MTSPSQPIAPENHQRRNNPSRSENVGPKRRRAEGLCLKRSDHPLQTKALRQIFSEPAASGLRCGLQRSAQPRAHGTRGNQRQVIHSVELVRDISWVFRQRRNSDPSCSTRDWFTNKLIVDAASCLFSSTDRKAFSIDLFARCRFGPRPGLIFPSFRQGLSRRKVTGGTLSIAHHHNEGVGSHLLGP